MRRWAITSILLLCLILVSAIACNPFGSTQGSSQQLVKVVRGDVRVTVSGSGKLDVTNDAQLAFSSGGKIEKIYVHEGDRVTKGTALAKLDTGALELALTQAKVARDEAEYNLNQLTDVLHASYDRVKIAEAQLKAAEQAVAQAQQQLDEATLIAPFAGVVASVEAKEGDFTRPPTVGAQTIIHLIDPTSMELNAEVDEIDIPQVKLGQRAIIEIDALPDAEFEGKVTSISTLAVEVAGVVLYEVTISLVVPTGLEIKVGMSASTDIVTSERRNVLLVPNRAIKRDSQGNARVEVKVNEQVEERPVVTGISDGIQTEIVDGLSEDETVVIQGSS